MLQFLQNHRRILLLIIFYAAVSKLAHTLLFTIVSGWVLLTSHGGEHVSDTINEVASQFIFVAAAGGALLVSLSVWLGDKALYVHRPFWNAAGRPVWQLERSAKLEFTRGLMTGTLIAVVLLSALTAAGHVNYLGVFLTSTVGTPTFPLFFSDLISLITFVACEEYIFRHRMLPDLLRSLGPHAAVLITTLFYLAIKYMQFPLTGIDIINIVLVNFTLGYFYLKSEKPHRGLALWASLTAALHSIAGLPLWGQTSPSLFLFKHSTKASDLLTGGISGPMASVGMTCILVIIFFGAYFSWRSDNPVI